MNALDDDLRTMFARQAEAMPVPVPIIGQPIARVTSLDHRRPRRWLLAAAAVALVGAGGLALAQRQGRTPVDPAAPPSTEPEAAPAFRYETPTVRLSADTIQVIVGASTFVPHDVAVHSDPGDSRYTTLELTWTDGGQEQRIFVYFASDGTQWWADEIRTYGAPGEEPWITTQDRWFTSPLGTAWTGDLDLPNLHIGGMSLEAFRRPDVCAGSTGGLAVVSAYSAIDGVVGSGFAGYVRVIDTATCTVLVPTAFTLRLAIDDPSVATADGPDEITDGRADETTRVQPLGYDLSFLAVGDTTLRFTVIDATGAEIGTATVPVSVRAADGMIAPTAAVDGATVPG